METSPLMNIAKQVIRNANGIAIFTAMRASLWISGAGGSGVALMRKPDGSWSPPSSIMIHAPLLRFSPGVDLYDCVLVMNTEESFSNFLKPRFTIGDETGSGPGPLRSHDTYIRSLQAPTPIYSYAKSKGSLKDLHMDGLIVIERVDENERFYSEPISASRILTGELRYPTKELKALMETLKASQGGADVIERLMPTQPSPGDMQISQEDGPVFGIPDFYDPDPFGVVELESAGIAIKEAGTHRRASSEQFHFQPKITSPIYGTFRKSMDSKGFNRQLSWVNSRTSLDRRTSMTDSATQTDPDGPSTPRALSPKSSMDLHSRNGSIAMGNIPEDIPENVPENESTEPETETGTTVDFASIKYDTPISSSTSPISEISENIRSKSETALIYTPPPPPPVASKSTPAATSPPTSMSVEDLNNLRMQLKQIKTFGAKPDLSAPPKLHIPNADEVAREGVATPVSIPKARLVTVAKRVPPKLPPRNPYRAHRRPSANTLDSVDREQPETMADDPSTTKDSGGISPLSSSPTRLPEPAPETSSSRSVAEMPLVPGLAAQHDDDGNPWK